MSFYDRIKQASNRILSTDMQPLTLTNASNVSYIGQGRYTDIDFAINPQGQQVNGRQNTLGFSISEFESITGTDETYKNWKATFLNSKGETMTGLFNNIFIDRTLDYVQVKLTRIKS